MAAAAGGDSSYLGGAGWVTDCTVGVGTRRLLGKQLGSPQACVLMSVGVVASSWATGMELD